MLDKLKLKEETIDVNTAQGVERIALTFAWMKRWQDSKQLSPQRRQLLLQLHTMYPDYLCNDPKRIIKERSFGLDFELEKAILANFWPESNGEVDWVREHHGKSLEGYDKSLKYVQLPCTDQEGAIITHKLITSHGLNIDEKFTFGGFANNTKGTTFFWKDVPPTVYTHEFEHLAYPGVRLDYFGTALNEGLTEWRGLHKAKAFSTSILRSGHVSHSYANELRMVNDLFMAGPNNKEVLMDHYEQRNPQTAYAWVSQITNEFSLEAILDIYRTKPSISECAYKLYGNHWGVVYLNKLPVKPAADAFGIPEVEAANLSPIYLSANEAVTALGISQTYPYSWDPATIFRDERQKV